jgi:SAM-dependent methyltransferase
MRISADVPPRSVAFDPEAVRAFEYASWQRAAGSYLSSFAAATMPFIDALLDGADVGAGMRVLDVACGPGLVASRAAERGAIATGLDFSTAMLAVARARDATIRLDEGDAEALPYDADSFDAVVSNFGVHHVPRPRLALREARRVLRHGGRVAFSFWAERSENVAWQLLFDAIERRGDSRASATPPPGGGFDTTESCIEALRHAGFADCTTVSVRATWRHSDAQSLVTALRSGTARMAALIEAQPAAAMPGILADIDEHAERFREGDHIGVPIAAVIVGGTKP